MSAPFGSVVLCYCSRRNSHSSSDWGWGCVVRAPPVALRLKRKLEDPKAPKAVFSFHVQ